MKLMVISFLTLLFFLPFVSSFEFNFTYPSIVNQNESFPVKVFSNITSDTYDVKIYVYDDLKEFSETFDGLNWKSSRYYLISVYPDTKEFNVRSHFVGDTNICVKLRKAGHSSSDEVCNPIKVSEAESPPPEEHEKNTSENNKTQEDSLKTKPSNNETKNSFSQSNIVKKSSSQNSYPENDKIVLNEKENKPVSFISREEKIRLSLIYVFSFICIVIIILLSFKRL